MKGNFNFMCTGIGSVPFIDVKETCVFIFELFPDMPFWPQFVKRSINEDMIIQFSEGFPFVVSEGKRRLMAIRDDKFEKKLLKFYESFLAEDINFFSISYDFAPGLYETVDLAKKNNGHFIKGQLAGPITFAASIFDKDGKAVINDPELMDVCVKGIAAKALWQIRKLKESGRIPIIFFDEPYLSSIGSAFSTINCDSVVKILKEVIEYVRAREDVIIGIHCCGNTDWSMIIEAEPDIISFDAFKYLEHFLIYKERIKDFLEKGGSIAWGIIPSTDMDFEKGNDIDLLLYKLKDAFLRLKQSGIDPNLISDSSILTPSCGIGTMEPNNAKKAMTLLLELSEKISDFLFDENNKSTTK